MLPSLNFCGMAYNENAKQNIALADCFEKNNVNFGEYICYTKVD